MARAAGERDVLREVAQHAVDAGPREAVAAELQELFFVLALAAADDRGEDLDLRTGGQAEHAVDHLLETLLRDRGAAFPAVGGAGAGEQQAQVVGDLGDRADGAAGALADAFLLDRDGGGQSLDRLDFGACQLIEELPCVARQALDITPLTLGVERVEGEARFAGAGGAGDDDELVARNRDVDVLQVVGARAVDRDLFGITAGGQSGDRLEIPGEAGIDGISSQKSPSSRRGSAGAARRSI